MSTMENNEENLKNLIRKTGEEKITLNFTENVMQGIRAELQNEASKELSLKSLLQKHAIEEPSPHFQLQVMGQLKRTQSISYAPIISGKTWYGIAAAVAVVLLACYFYPSSSAAETPRFIFFVGRISQSVQVIPEAARGFWDLCVLTLIGLSGLLLMDYFLRGKASPGLNKFFNRLAKS